MFTFNDQEYDLRYSIKRVEQIEAVIGKPIMASVVQNNAMLSIAEAKSMIAYGMVTSEGAHIAPAQGMKMAEALLEQQGYANVIGLIIEALERDCPFFFQAD